MSTLLVVDDEAMVLSGLSRLLRRNSLFSDVEFARRPDDVERILRDTSRDVSCVVTDFRMPDWSGFDVLRLAGSLRPAARRVIMAADIQPIMRAMEMNIGLVHAVLAKPFHSGEFISAIASAQAS